MTSKQKVRKERSLVRLEAQLKSGVKNKKVHGVPTTIPLTDSDKRRINKEISTLKSRV